MRRIFTWEFTIMDPSLLKVRIVLPVVLDGRTSGVRDLGLCDLPGSMSDGFDVDEFGHHCRGWQWRRPHHSWVRWWWGSTHGRLVLRTSGLWVGRSWWHENRDHMRRSWSRHVWSRCRWSSDLRLAESDSVIMRYELHNRRLAENHVRPWYVQRLGSWTKAVRHWRMHKAITIRRLYFNSHWAWKLAWFHNDIVRFWFNFRD